MVISNIIQNTNNEIIMEIVGIHYGGDKVNYVVPQYHIYHIKDKNLNNSIMTKIKESNIPELFCTDKINIGEFTNINIKKYYRVHWGNFPGHFEYHPNKTTKYNFISPTSDENGTTFFDSFNKYTRVIKNIPVKYNTGIVIDSKVNKKNDKLYTYKIAFNTNGVIKDPNTNHEDGDQYLNLLKIKKWSNVLTTDNNLRKGTMVIIINSILIAKKNSDVSYLTQLCGSINYYNNKLSPIPTVINIKKKVKRYLDNKKEEDYIYTPDYGINFLTNFESFPITSMNILNEKKICTVDISGSNNDCISNKKEWKITITNNNTIKEGDMVYISFIKNHKENIKYQVAFLK